MAAIRQSGFGRKEAGLFSGPGFLAARGVYSRQKVASAKRLNFSPVRLVFETYFLDVVFEPMLLQALPVNLSLVAFLNGLVSGACCRRRVFPCL
jgi:hypothetical protein